MDGKKKKNKKKKGGSQSKLAEDVQNASAEEVVAPERYIGAPPQVKHLRQVSSTTDVQSVGVSESDVELDRHKVYEERFVKLQEEVRQLQEEKNQWLQKEASLEEKVKLLQNDVDSCIKTEAGLEEKLENLQSGNDSFIQKEAILDARVKHVEGIKDSWILKETLINEMASRLDEVNIRLQAQVLLRCLQDTILRITLCSDLRRNGLSAAEFKGTLWSRLKAEWNGQIDSGSFT